MATVYLAYDTQFKRHVAIKVLPQQFLHDPSFRSRFEREAQVIANLEHHAIVPVYDYGNYQNQPYLVMRYLPGGTLRDRLLFGPIPLDQIKEIIFHLASALDKAHSRGIIHRDIKATNVLFDEERKPYLSDFGIAFIMAQTNTITFLGTPEYMAPEQWAGKNIDARTDIYLFGAMLFEMLTGEVPFKADSPPALMHKHIYEPVPSVRHLNSRLPAALDRVINCALAKKQDQRYQSAGELSVALNKALSDDSKSTIQLRTNQSLRTIKRFFRPGKVLTSRWILSAVILLGILIGFKAFFSNDSSLIPADLTSTAATVKSLAITGTQIISNTPESPPTLTRTTSPTAGNIHTHTPTPSLTPSPRITPTETELSTPTRLPTFTPTDTPRPLPTFTRIPQPTDTPTPAPANTGGDSGGGKDKDGKKKEPTR
ncbi:MAG: protein kinase [Anaerolineales bacterium]|nr:protein kinase [Anaerolineales bacterium]